MAKNTYYSAREMMQLMKHAEYFKQAMDYTRFVAKPNPAKGASGAICPFVPKALQLNSVYFSIVELESMTTKAITDALDAAVEHFQQLEPTTGDHKMYKTFLMVFPNIPEEKLDEMIVDTHLHYKRKLTLEGLMIGEFFATNPHHGLHSETFYPMQTPTPMMALRYLVPEDLPFLIKESDPAEARIDFLTGYLKTFADTLDDERRQIAEDALAKARAE